MTLAVSGLTDPSANLNDSSQDQLRTGTGHQTVPERLLETATAGDASETVAKGALPTARGAELAIALSTAAAGPENCATRQCCQDNSCSTSLSHEHLGTCGSSSAATDAASIDDDTGCPRTSLDSEGSHHLRRLSSSLGSLEMGAQPNHKSAKTQAAQEPLLEDNDDRFCLFPIK